MGEYSDRVERQRQRLAAEEWARGISQLHVHQLKSLWYDNDETRCDMDGGPVSDTVYNDGRIERRQNGLLIRTFGDVLTGDALVDKFSRESHG